MPGPVSALDRVMASATQLFVERGFNDVSIAEIAAEARCSTATIYDMFDTKENLFLSALKNGHDTWGVPTVGKVSDDGQALAAILRYCHDLIENLTRPTALDLLKAAVSKCDQTRLFITSLYRERNQMPDLILMVAAAIRSGHIAPGDADGIAYCLNAGASYEPTLLGIQDLGSVEPLRLTSTIIGPFLTEAGRAEMARWCDAIRDPALAEDPVRPWQYFASLESGA